MILRKFQWFLLLSFQLLCTVTAQDGKTYDTNDWIPITPTNPPESKEEIQSTQKAQGRVLNLDAPNQNFFPENEYVRKRTPQPQQYLRETVVPKGATTRQKPQQPYKFEPVLTVQPPQYIPQNEFVQPQYVQTLQQLPFVQPVQQIQQRPLQEPILNQQLVAPPQTTQNYYDSSGNINQTLLLASLNQELLGAVQHQNIDTTTTTKPKEEKESVQLLYVPLENLKPQTPKLPTTQTPRREKHVPRIQNQLGHIENDFIRQALAAHKLQQQFQLGEPVVLQTTTTTPKPKKRKPNQPPLAVYMEKQGAAEVKDVLEVLKNAKSISVQDSIGPETPQIFVGPSNIEPDGYVKFPLPYLSSVQSNRIERKVEQLPFFVAPLTYKTPEGYSKIPLPSPHVGSVVVKEQLHEKNTEVRQPQTAQNQIVPDFDVKQPFKPNAYQALPNQNALLEQFLGTFPQNPQNYEATSPRDLPDDYRVNQETPKEFVTNYQLGLRQHPPQYDYRSEEKPDYEIPEYQNNDRELPNQDSKEFIPNYDIPSVPVESKTTFAPQNQPNLYNFNEQPVRQPSTTSTTTTTTTEAPIIPQTRQYKYTPQQEYRTTEVPIVPQSRFKYTTPQQEYGTTEAPIIPQSQYKYTPQQEYGTTEAPIVPQSQYKYTPQQEYGTTEAPIVPQSQYKYTPQQEYAVPEYNIRSNPFQQVINQHEIEQINSQFGLPKEENVQQIRTTTPAIVSTQKYIAYEIPSTTKRSRSRSRHRGRTTTTSTTPDTFSEENYTILEEFDIKPKTTTVKYTTEVETIPAKVYKLEPQPPQQPQPGNVYKLDIPPSQPVYNLEPQPPPQSVYKLEAQSPPQSVYKLEPQQPEPAYLKDHPLKQLILNQEALDRQVLQVNTHTRKNPEPVLYSREHLPPTNIPSKQITEQDEVYNRDQEELPQINAYNVPGLLINNLQDQAVRPLLIPNLLVPTTEKLSTQPPIEEIVIISTTTTTTTEAPTTTQRRSRGRQRAHTRVSSTSAPRRNVNRRRPNYTRPTTERQYVRTTTESSEYEPTRRARFRTRGRPLKEQVATERLLPQTTENVFKQPALEGGFQASSGDPQSYMQFDNVVNHQQVITVNPRQNNEEVPFKEYHQVYSLPSQAPSTERVLEEISTTSKPVVDIKIIHPVTQEPVIITTPSDDSRYIRVNTNIQSGGVIHNNRNEDVPSRAPARSRVRSRTRSRFSSTTRRPTTTTRITTTPRPQQPQDEEDDEEEEEFYGFIRKPSFSKPEPVVYTTTQQSLPLYSSHYQEPSRTIIRLEDSAPNQEPESSSPPHVQFVGEIRPKYTTEAQIEEHSTEPPKFRARARIRIPNRKASQSYNEVKPQKLDDQVTRRSSVIRTRSRGKSHFKGPDTVRKDEHDVEGGNYPATYLKQLTTEKPSAFQITIDPSDEEVDQEPHSSLYSPQIIRNTETEWVEASIPDNNLEIEDKNMFVVSSEEGTTLPAEEQTETEIPTTTEPVETTTPRRRKVGRRRGVWKLVKQKPIDSFETAESQNYYSVQNAFDGIEKKRKVDVTTTTTTPPTRRHRTRITTTTEASIFETLYSMLGLASKASQGHESKTKVAFHKEEVTTTPASPTFPEEITEETTTQEIKVEEETTTPPTTVKNYDVDAKTSTTTVKIDEENREEEASTATAKSYETEDEASTESVKNYEIDPWKMTEEEVSTDTVKNYEVESWQNPEAKTTVKNGEDESRLGPEIRTSTTTEISHETEICYKGRCIKSKDDDDKL